MRPRNLIVAAAAVAGVVVAIAHADGPDPQTRVAVQVTPPAWRVSLASAYSRVDSPGRMACSGERVPWNSLQVAHKTLPCGTRLRVCAAPRRCVTVRVADRGPYIHPRELDFTPGVYRALGAGSAEVWGVRRVWWRVMRPDEVLR